MKRAGNIDEAPASLAVVEREMGRITGQLETLLADGEPVAVVSGGRQIDL
jgi:hypothetical protein